MTDKAAEREQTALGILLVSLVLVVYRFFWVPTWGLARLAGNELVGVLSMVVAVCVLLLAYFLYFGSRTAWWIGLVFIGASTVWRLSLVAGGN